MQDLRLYTLIGVILVFVIGCDVNNSRFSRYHEYQDTPPDGKSLMLPQGLSNKLLSSNYYTIPAVSHNKKITRVSLIPPGSNLARYSKSR